MPTPIIPIKNLSTSDVLYGDRTTEYRWEVLSHNPANGVDSLGGVLDGVSGGSLQWTQNTSVKGGGNVTVVDLATAQSGQLKISDLTLENVRLRPVCTIAGLPEIYLGVFLVSAATENWEGTGRSWGLVLLDKATVLDQDEIDQSYSVAAGSLILQTVKTILASAGETITVDASSTLVTSTGMVWEAGTSKLKIINDLLDVANYNSLWVDGYGNFQATPRVLPADRSITYELLTGVPRELRDGEKSIYKPSWTRDRDSYDVPNKVIAVEAADGDAPALVGSWTNTDPASPYSTVRRGFTRSHTLDSVETPEGTDAEKIAFLQKRAQTTLIQMSAVQATVQVEHLPIPIRVSDVLQFASTRAGINAKHVITKLQLDTSPLGMMKSTLQEVISL